jgi:hypothetical protein
MDAVLRRDITYAMVAHLPDVAGERGRVLPCGSVT